MASTAPDRSFGALALLDNMVAIRRQPEKALPIVRRVLATLSCSKEFEARR